ncbi:hypothetical protein P872_04795 [Rhodonellum psychrophilum GCM71 = DSM 17998]|uniref:Uncharacterized protein n=1 Tax=Rhodonellum psychrophilum GCM71 = DSM 17998 TaxID=1123057 RepID=U5BZF8_9BACT|nr:hypothetical protein P872_04795 [Rhodonellum psychrophilum GCM71 = DSM 17998]
MSIKALGQTQGFFFEKEILGFQKIEKNDSLNFPKQIRPNHEFHES